MRLLNTKRAGIYAFMLTMVGVLFLGNMQAFAKENISLDKQNKTLTAPEAANYQWLLNGEVLAEQSETLSISASGEYTVVMTDEDGVVSKSSINLQVNAAGDVIVIYTIGDSTVQTYAEGYYPRTGWGQVIQNFFDTNYVKVDNRAVGGTSAKSFYNYYWKEDGDYGQIVTELDSGDYVFIQFGINDSNTDTSRYTDPYTTFQEYLGKYVTQARAKGAIPVIVSTLRKNSWNDDGTVYNAYHNYPLAAIDLADSLDVPLINLHKRCGDLMNELGQDYTTGFWYNNYDAGEYENYPSGNTDNTHFQENGAVEMARLVVSEIQNNDSDFDSFDNLAKYVKGNYTITMNLDDSDAGIVTRTAAYPEGTPVSLKIKLNDGYELLGWLDENNDTVSTELVYGFAMETASPTYTAITEYEGFGSSEIWMEAECGDIGSLWNVVEDETASNGKYVTIQEGNTSGSSAPSSTGQITYTFTVEEGSYYMYWRVLLPSVEEDSYWMKLDDESWAKVTWDEAYTEWTWKQVEAIDLATGEHTLIIGYREDGALLDKIHIGSTIPTGEGDSCACEETAIIEYSVEDGFSQNVWADDAQLITISYTMESSANVYYAIYNAVGQIVYQESLGYLNEGVNTYSVSVDLQPGIYILKSNADNNVKASKFLVK